MVSVLPQQTINDISFAVTGHNNFALFTHAKTLD